MVSEEILEAAREMGREAARNAASWVLDGNASAEHYQRLLTMLEEGDPAAEFYLPRRPNLSGEWAGDPTPMSVAEDAVRGYGEAVELVPDTVDLVADAWEEGVDATFEPECERLLRAALLDR
jgi:hypothetical protein